MCLIFISLKQHPTFKLIVAANRDEFYNRKTAAADFWNDYPDVLGGRDLEAGGTWLGVTRKGKISMVTNFRDPKNIKANAPSRGHLVSDYLCSDIASDAFLHELVPRQKEYNGFNLVSGTVDQLAYISNYGNGISVLDNGLFGLSNHLLDTPWPKVVKGKQRMSAIIKGDVTPAALFDLMADEGIASDDLLPDTGIGLDRERALSAMFIKTVGYGTRCSTVILVDYNNDLFFAERVYNLIDFSYTEKSFDFKIR